MTVVPAGLGVGAVLAHQGGWDEILLVLTPVALFAGLLWLANSRATRLQEERTTSPAESPPPDDHEPESPPPDDHEPEAEAEAEADAPLESDRADPPRPADP